MLPEFQSEELDRSNYVSSRIVRIVDRAFSTRIFQVQAQREGNVKLNIMHAQPLSSLITVVRTRRRFRFQLLSSLSC